MSAASGFGLPLTRVLRFVVPGRPVPLQRARVVQKILPRGNKVHRNHLPEKSMAYRSIIQLHANVARSATPAVQRWPYRMTGPVALSIWIFWADDNHGDCDNVYKGVADAGNGILWEDDKQIIEGHFFSAVDRKNPRVEVLIEERAP